jgi:tetratricopeptide (TPR) repeat protein
MKRYFEILFELMSWKPLASHLPSRRYDCVRIGVGFTHLRLKTPRSPGQRWPISQDSHGPGKDQMEKKRYALAIRSFSAAIRRDPRLSEAYLLRGKANDQVGKPQEAIKDFTRYIELNPSDPRGYVSRGDAKNFNLEHEAAVQDYSAAIKLALLSRCVSRPWLAYAGLAKYDEAIKDYQWVLKINPNNAEALGNMGVANMLAGRPVEAMSYFERALQHETNPQWRAKIEQWMEKLLQGASAAKQKIKGPTR